MNKRYILLSVLCFSVMLFVVSCKMDNAQGGKTIYLLRKTKEILGGQTKDYQEINYTSTNPVVVNEFVVFNWIEDGGKWSIHSKFIFKNIIKTASTITLDAELLLKTGDIEEYGSFFITLNEDGSMQKADFISKIEDVKDTKFQVEYNIDGYLTKITVAGDINLGIDVTYEDGNISKVSYVEDGVSTSQSLYSDYKTENRGGIMHPFLMGGDGIFDIFASLNILGKHHQKLPSKAVWSDLEDVHTYTYEKNTDGCISKFTYNIGGGEEKIYTYEYIEVVKNRL